MNAKCFHGFSGDANRWILCVQMLLLEILKYAEIVFFFYVLYGTLSL
uniref:Uncharacterized protein n=1 Tax=Rhizophora mucronata TaxID=61149 RepID=A0A2P2QUY1_RHIMU